MSRLNGWQRLGIIASILWFFVGEYVGAEQAIHESEAIFELKAKHCWYDYSKDAKLIVGSPAYEAAFAAGFAAEKACLLQVQSEWSKLAVAPWKIGLISGLAPIPFAWLAVYGFVAVFRWVRAGFKQQVS